MADYDRTQLATALTQWLDTVPEANRDWAEALFAASFDESGRDSEKALKLAKALYDADPEGP